MPTGKKRKPRHQAVEIPIEAERDSYWKKQISQLGRNVMFVDAGAILEAHTPGDERYSHYFSTVTDKLITSSFVVAETVRRLVKSRPYDFQGPSGQQAAALAIHFIRTWLADHRVEVLHLPKEVFEFASQTFEGRADIGCDLNDIISFIVVTGLEQKRIVAKDRHFRDLGLTLLPG
jgi:predicted nucleic acid-binding protein